MALPDLVEIVPIKRPVRAEITVPGSKSITNRALILAALANGETKLQGALWSEDTQVMVSALRQLGFEIDLTPDPKEFCNRTITLKGLGGNLQKSGSVEKPLDIFVENAGTVARFLAALVCLGRGVYRLDGTPRMRERPQAALFQALRELGYRIDSPNDKLPAIIHGVGPRAGKCRVTIEESSQFASALLLCAERGRWSVEISGKNSDEAPYVSMTSKLVQAFPKAGGQFAIEPDASSGSYFWGANWLLGTCEVVEALESAARNQSPSEIVPGQFTEISVGRWPTTGWQIDADIIKLLLGRAPPTPVQAGDTPLPTYRVNFNLPGEISRERDLGDSIMTAAVLAPFMNRMIQLTDLGRLRVQETERVSALRTELTRCGARVVEKGETLTILPSSQLMHGAEIETYNDHRMAMCFATLGLKVPGIKLKNPSCVKKTFPNFFQKLAAPPPHGLGATILDAANGRKLAQDELFAE